MDFRNIFHKSFLQKSAELNVGGLEIRLGYILLYIRR